MELFNCQTCENSYHAHCMTPSLDPSQVPSFWFCPHCVDRELHIPDSLAQTLDSAPPYPSPNSLVESPEKASGLSDPVASIQAANLGRPPTVADTPPTKLTRPLENISNPKPATKSRPHPTDASHDPRAKKLGRARQSFSPVRKKSKYSTFSAEVDKALSILYSELETAARYGKSEDNLQTKVQDLEQTLRLQEGKMKLSSRELEILRKKLADKHSESTRLMSENVGYKEEIRKLHEIVELKDRELRSWQIKLRTMMGSELPP